MKKGAKCIARRRITVKGHNRMVCAHFAGVKK